MTGLLPSCVATDGGESCPDAVTITNRQRQAGQTLGLATAQN